MSSPTLTARVLNDGTAEGPVLVLEKPVSFWGGFDPQEGRILEASHPQRGQTVRGQVLVMTHGIGSAGTPAGVTESIRNGSGPVAVILRSADVNIAVGAMVAASLYDKHVPVIELTDPDYQKLMTGQVCLISKGGEVRVTLTTGY